MKYALKLARNGSVFIVRVVWVGVVLAVELFLLLLNSSSKENDHNIDAEIPDPFDRMHPNWRYYWDQQKNDLD
ncbi:hypothetical protein [Alcaligenes faecalis]|uniref:hypothetical protein n=1 Tax=Alcaligenes faecalis TaxID=511 RepID=UPI00122D0150|nr:hypothetical protein [Alcaligenes faecalis]KAA1284800.1 hypothetical protein D7S43_15270 [Alcaligenes faecalis]QRF90604.1 hypothetical protein CLH39_10330 [Alcaligenes faecalis]